MLFFQNLPIVVTSLRVRQGESEVGGFHPSLPPTDLRFFKKKHNGSISSWCAVLISRKTLHSLTSFPYPIPAAVLANCSRFFLIQYPSFTHQLGFTAQCSKSTAVLTKFKVESERLQAGSQSRWAGSTTQRPK